MDKTKIDIPKDSEKQLDLLDKSESIYATILLADPFTQEEYDKYEKRLMEHARERMSANGGLYSSVTTSALSKALTELKKRIVPDFTLTKDGGENEGKLENVEMTDHELILSQMVARGTAAILAHERDVANSKLRAIRKLVVRIQWGTRITLNHLIDAIVKILSGEE